MIRIVPRVRRTGCRWLPLIALFAATAAAAAPTPPSIPLHQPKNEFRVHTIDVHQGQAVLVQTLQGKNILLDAGEDYASPKLIGYLKKIGVKKIDWLVISHRHMDHIGGVPALAREFSVDHLVTPWGKGKVPETAMAWLAPLRKDIKQGFGPKNRPAFHTAITGRTFDFGGGAKAEVLWPPKATGGLPIGDYNEESVVMRVSQKAPKSRNAASFVVGGDLGWQIERHLAKKMPNKLRADGLVGNHHGSKGSFERTYLEGVAGHTSSLLVGGPQGTGPMSKLAKAVVKLSKEKNGKALASQVGLLLYQANNGQTGAVGPGESFAQRPQTQSSGGQAQVDKLAREIANSLQQDAKVGGKFPWVTYSAGAGNPYNHPNSERMALSTLLGCTMLGTDDQGSVVMTRKVGNDGKWTAGWEGHTMGTLGLPDVASRMPFYKLKKDPKNPYDDVAREANYIFMIDHPDPTVSWSDKEQHLAPKGRSETTVFLMAARRARKGRKAFVGEFRALRQGDSKEQKKADALASKAKAKPWHGEQMDGTPWDQDGNSIWAQQNARWRRTFGKPRWALRNSTLGSRLLGKHRGRGLGGRRQAARNSSLAKLFGAVKRGGSSLGLPWIQARRPGRPQVRQAQRNASFKRPLGRPSWMSRPLAPRPLSLRR